MSDLNVLICDDQPGMRLILRKMVERQEGFTVCGEAADGNECLALFEQTKPEVVFLDVEMPGKDGLACAQVLQDIAPRTFLIFATAHERFMDKAFEVYAFDYLVKPFSIERVAGTLSRIQMLCARTAPIPLPAEPRKPRAGRLLLKNGDALALVDMDDVILIQRENRSTVVYTARAAYQSADTLTALEGKLDMNQFFRSHKSYLINLSYIDDITPYGRWTYVVRFKGIKQDALITHERFEQLKELFG